MIHLRTPTLTPLAQRLAAVLAYGADPSCSVSPARALHLAATLVVEHDLMTGDA
jgi:hypothetical protein